MSEKLSDIVDSLRRELNGLTRVHVERQHEEDTAFMVQSQAVSAQIDELEAFIFRRHDERCMAVLRKKMSQYFSIDETKTLIHDGGISDFEWEGSTVSGMHSELIQFCERREQLPDLITALRDSRPRVQWPDC